MMTNALIGFSGFVGSSLQKQTQFESLYRSTNIHEIQDRSFDTVVCAGAPAQKWLANREPNSDKQKIDHLTTYLKTIKCKQFVLVSTVDVFQQPIEVDETSLVDESNLQAYGLHRRFLEKFVIDKFPDSLIIRLPGLVGPGLRKNIIFDLLNDNSLDAIDSRAIFQFYPMVNLWYDIQIAIQAKLSLVHLTSAPLSVAELALKGFGIPYSKVLEHQPAKYDMRTRYASIFGTTGPYQYDSRASLQAIRAYAQSEPLTVLVSV